MSDYLPPVVDDYREYWERRLRAEPVERQARILWEPLSTESQMFFASVADAWLNDEPVEVSA